VLQMEELVGGSATVEDRKGGNCKEKSVMGEKCRTANCRAVEYFGMVRVVVDDEWDGLSNEPKEKAKVPAPCPTSSPGRSREVSDPNYDDVNEPADSGPLQ
jgi:hypothetical protein